MSPREARTDALCREPLLGHSAELFRDLHLISRCRVATHRPAEALTMTKFNPNAAATGGGIFGLPSTPDNARVGMAPVPFEATTNHGGGTSSGPRAIHVGLRDLSEEARFGETWTSRSCNIIESLASEVYAVGDLFSEPACHPLKRTEPEHR